MNVNGKPVRLGTDEAEVFTAYGQFLKDKGKAPNPSPTTHAEPLVTDLINHFLDWCKEHLRGARYVRVSIVGGSMYSTPRCRKGRCVSPS